MSTQKIKVSLDFGTYTHVVGTLVEQNQQIHFRFESNFLHQSIDISPFKLKKSSEIIPCPKVPFDGIFGVFNDSIPDGWGRLLLDRKLIENGKNPKGISVLDRLALIGKKGQGALIYEPVSETQSPAPLVVDLDAIAFESTQLLQNGGANLLDELYHLGGNSVGARPKIQIYVNPKSKSISIDERVESESWIIKFSALNDLRDGAKIEYAYYLMALDCGINMSPSHLFESASGKSYFGTKRFDVENKNRLHLHSACGLLHDDFRYSTMDYGHVMDAANRLQNDLHTNEQVFRIAIFNVYACNMDDHSKNIGFLMNEKGEWKLAPAYDLTYSPSPGNYHSMSIAGNYQHIDSTALLKLAAYFEIKNAVEIIEQVKENIARWRTIATNCGIQPNVRNLIDKSIHEVLLK